MRQFMFSCPNTGYIVHGQADDARRERAKARGVKFGRKLKLTPHQRREALARREAGEALADIGRTFGVKPLDDLEARACGRLIG